MWTKLPVSVWLLQISIQITTCTNRHPYQYTHLRGKGLNRLKSVLPDWLYFPEVRAYHSDLMCSDIMLQERELQRKQRVSERAYLLVVTFFARWQEHWGAREQGIHRQAQLLLTDLVVVCVCPLLQREIREKGNEKSRLTVDIPQLGKQILWPGSCLFWNQSENSLASRGTRTRH